MNKAACFGVLIVSLFAGCAYPPQASFQTWKDPEYHAPISKVLIVTQKVAFLEKMELPADYMDRIVARLKESLAKRNVQTEVMEINLAELDPAAKVVAEATRIRPSQLLSISMVSAHSKQSGRERVGGIGAPLIETDRSITLGYIIRDVPNMKIVWRGDAEFDPPPNPEEAAERCMTQLETEHLF